MRSRLLACLESRNSTASIQDGSPRGDCVPRQPKSILAANKSGCEGHTRSSREHAPHDPKAEAPQRPLFPRALRRFRCTRRLAGRHRMWLGEARRVTHLRCAPLRLPQNSTASMEHGAAAGGESGCCCDGDARSSGQRASHDPGAEDLLLDLRRVRCRCRRMRRGGWGDGPKRSCALYTVHVWVLDACARVRKGGARRVRVR